MKFLLYWAYSKIFINRINILSLIINTQGNGRVRCRQIEDFLEVSSRHAGMVPQGMGNGRTGRGGGPRVGVAMATEGVAGGRSNALTHPRREDDNAALGLRPRPL